MKIIILTSHAAQEWDGGGDSLITAGVKVLLPELDRHELIYHPEIPHDHIEDAVASSDYVIHAGTPAWVSAPLRRYWPQIIKHDKPVVLLGVGLAYPNAIDLWFGPDGPVGTKGQIKGLQRHKRLGTIVCRDKFCYRRLKALGFKPAGVLPCPAFYTLPMRSITSKREVVFSIPNTLETSRSKPEAFVKFFEKGFELIGSLRNRGANVHVIYQRSRTGMMQEGNGSESAYRSFLGRSSAALGAEVQSFDSFREFSDFMSTKDCYIGVRNHGAFPCAGSGMPSLLLGTDYRQFMADEVPFISRIDISHIGWETGEVLRWYDALDPAGTCSSLHNFRAQTQLAWADCLAPVRKSLCDHVTALST